MNKLQASHTAARLQEGVGWGSPGYLTDATHVSLLLWVVLQETKLENKPCDQESTRLSFPQTLVPRVWTEEGRASPHCRGSGPPTAPSDPTEGSLPGLVTDNSARIPLSDSSADTMWVSWPAEPQVWGWGNGLPRGAVGKARSPSPCCGHCDVSSPGL